MLNGDLCEAGRSALVTNVPEISHAADRRGTRQQLPRTLEGDTQEFNDAVLGGLKAGLSRRRMLTTRKEHGDEHRSSGAHYFSSAVNLGEALASTTVSWMKQQDEAEVTLEIWEQALQRIFVSEHKQSPLAVTCFPNQTKLLPTIPEEFGTFVLHDCCRAPASHRGCGAASTRRGSRGGSPRSAVRRSSTPSGASLQQERTARVLHAACGAST